MVLHRSTAATSPLAAADGLQEAAPAAA
jgi:hypothetical protein